MSDISTIYLDYAATTPIDPRVIDKMSPFLSDPHYCGNSASTHAWGQRARQAVSDARAAVAALIDAVPEEIIWTSGATESNNLALKGVMALYQARGKHIVTMKTEHSCVLETCQQLEKKGFSVTYLSPKRDGLLDTDIFSDALREDTVLVSIMHMNNETGVIQDIKTLSEITAARGILFHSDVAQSAGKIPISVKDMPVDLLSLSAHKFYGPKGIGALYLRQKPRVRVAPLFHGGGQEQGMRSGTLPVHQIVGMGAACAIAHLEMSRDLTHIDSISHRFLENFEKHTSIMINGDRLHAYPGIVNIGFPGVDARRFVEAHSSIAMSVGSACYAKGAEASYVLRAMGLTERDAAASIRFSFGRFTTEQEVDEAARVITPDFSLFCHPREDGDPC